MACAHAPGASVAVPEGEGVAAVEEARPLPLAPLTDEEQRLREELTSEVKALAELGPRSLAHTWNLYSATDHLARRLEVLGYSVQRQGFPVGDEVLQNLEVIVPGKTPGTLVVAAHYDSSGDSPGANASGTGSAVLLTLARQLVGRQQERSVRLVWLCNESSPSNRAVAAGAVASGAVASGAVASGAAPAAALTGSAVYAQQLQRTQVPVVATLTLGSLGYYSLSAGSQRYPEELLYGTDKRTRFGNFIAVLSNAGSNTLLEALRPASSTASLPVEELILPDSAPLAREGPQARFWGVGFSGLLLTDTAQFRSPHVDDPLDTPEQLDFDRLARVAKLLDEMVLLLAGPRAPR
ncbi:MAG: hypothetical protein RL685_2569 [Pseudomonadota bacterium]